MQLYAISPDFLSVYIPFTFHSLLYKIFIKQVMILLWLCIIAISIIVLSVNFILQLNFTVELCLSAEVNQVKCALCYYPWDTHQIRCNMSILKLL